MTEEETQELETIGWGHLFRNVNLRDFADMIRGEGIMIGTLARRAFAALPHLPFGPFVFAAFMALAWVRTFLLFAVVLFFGGAIVLINILRGFTSKQSAAAGPASED